MYLHVTHSHVHTYHTHVHTYIHTHMPLSRRPGGQPDLNGSGEGFHWEHYGWCGASCGWWHQHLQVPHKGQAFCSWCRSHWDWASQTVDNFWRGNTFVFGEILRRSSPTSLSPPLPLILHCLPPHPLVLPGLPPLPLVLRGLSPLPLVLPRPVLAWSSMPSRSLQSPWRPCPEPWLRMPELRYIAYAHTHMPVVSHSMLGICFASKKWELSSHLWSV